MEVILYSTGCPRCELLERKLKSNNITFTLNSNIEDMLALGIDAVPVLSIDGKLMDYKNSIKWLMTKGEGENEKQ